MTMILLLDNLLAVVYLGAGGETPWSKHWNRFAETNIRSPLKKMPNSNHSLVRKARLQTTPCATSCRAREWPPNGGFSSTSWYLFSKLSNSVRCSSYVYAMICTSYTSYTSHTYFVGTRTAHLKTSPEDRVRVHAAEFVLGCD